MKPLSVSVCEICKREAGKEMSADRRQAHGAYPDLLLQVLPNNRLHVEPLGLQPVRAITISMSPIQRLCREVDFLNLPGL